MNDLNLLRFRHTASALLDCKDTIEVMINNPARNLQLINAELAAAKELVEICFEVAELLTKYAAIDIDRTSADDMSKIMGMINARCLLTAVR
jgi:recombination DNA repair RAD52 pathway protein